MITTRSPGFSTWAALLIVEKGSPWVPGFESEARGFRLSTKYVFANCSGCSQETNSVPSGSRTPVLCPAADNLPAQAIRQKQKKSRAPRSQTPETIARRNPAVKIELIIIAIDCSFDMATAVNRKIGFASTVTGG